MGRAAYDWACELTIYLDHDARKHGMGRALYEALANRLQAMGILNLYACIGYPQVEDEYLTRNSARFHEHLALHWSAPSTTAGTSSAAGTTWSGWKRSLGSTAPTSRPCSPTFTKPHTQTAPDFSTSPGLFV